MIKPSQKQIVYKKLGETPLQALERFRGEMVAKNPTNAKEWSAVPMTYAGRLDPLAEGELLILIGDECRRKEKYLGLDKEYEVEIVVGISTDSYDALGLAAFGAPGHGSAGRMDAKERYVPPMHISKLSPPRAQFPYVLNNTYLAKYCGKFMQKYPPYSSKTVGGKQLHTLARAGGLPDLEDMPEKEVGIYSIETLGAQSSISVPQLLARITSMIVLVQGDFRQGEIMKTWRDLLENLAGANGADGNLPHFPIIKIRVKCSSGTYMRSLADKIGRDLGTGAFAISIKRTRILI